MRSQQGLEEWVGFLSGDELHGNQVEGVAWRKAWGMRVLLEKEKWEGIVGPWCMQAHGSIH